MNQSSNEITAVIPTYRRPVLVERAIWSVLSQTYPRVRVIVCDNASGDATAEVISRISARDPRVEYYCHQRNIGSYPNFNFGISRVKTPFFSLLSDDDLLAPGFYEQAMAAFRRYPDVGFVRLPTMVIDAECRVVSGPREVKTFRHYAAGEVFHPSIAAPMPEAWTGLVFRTDAALALGGIDEDAGPFADGGFVMRAAAKFAFAEAPGIGGILMAHRNSTSGTLAPFSYEWLAWWEKMIATIEEDASLSDLVRRNVRSMAYPDFARVAWIQFLSVLGDGNVAAAAQIARSLRQCGYAASPFAMSGLCLFCRWVPFAAKLVAAMKQREKAKRRLKSERLTRLYGNHLEFMGEFRRLTVGGPEKVSTV